MKTENQKGFTLIELLLVIAIIGLLVSIVTTVFISARDKSKDAKRLTDVKQISTALELHFDATGGYPVSGISSTSIPGLSPAYISQIPASPEPAGTGCSDAENEYIYRSIDGSNFILTYCLGTIIGSYYPDLYSLGPKGVNLRYDVNADGVFDNNDPVYLAQAAIGLVICPLELCDISGDGAVSNYDAALLGQILLAQ